MAAQHVGDRARAASVGRGRVVAAGQRELEVELAQPVAERRSRRGCGRRRAARARCAASAAAPRRARSAVGVDRPPAPLLLDPRGAARRAGRAPAGRRARGRACTSEPKVAPAGRSSIGEGRSRGAGRPSSGARRLETSSSTRRPSSSTVPSTSGSLSTPARPACSSARISPEYDVRRQSVSTPVEAADVERRRRARARTSAGAGRRARTPRRERAARSATAVSAASTSASVGTAAPCRAPRASPAPRPNSSRVRPAWPAFAGRRPPGDHLGLRAGERDVGQPQLLAGAPRPRARRDRLRRPGRRRAALAPASSWNSGSARRATTCRRSAAGRRRGTAGPCWRGWSRSAPPRVGVEPTGALVAGAAARRSSRSQSSRPGRPRPSRCCDLVEHLAEVVEVGEQPLAVGAATAPGRPARRR